MKDISSSDLTIRPVHELEVFTKFLDIQRAAWGFADVEVTPTHVFHSADVSGGQVLGAFTPQGEVIGFSIAFVAWDDKLNSRYLLSHKMAVHPAVQTQSIGFEIKQAQKREALRKGFKLIKWTYDPLLTKNANLNLRKLGARIYEFRENEYGIVKSELYGRVRSDRFVVTWDLLNDNPAEFPVKTESLLEESGVGPRVNDQVLNSGMDSLLLPVPLDVVTMRTANAILAQQWQEVVARICTTLLKGQYFVSGFRIDKSTGHERGEYLFERSSNS